jgi:hypothetical protein
MDFMEGKDIATYPARSKGYLTHYDIDLIHKYSIRTGNPFVIIDTIDSRYYLGFYHAEEVTGRLQEIFPEKEPDLKEISSKGETLFEFAFPNIMGRISIESITSILAWVWIIFAVLLFLGVAEIFSVYFLLLVILVAYVHVSKSAKGHFRLLAHRESLEFIWRSMDERKFDLPVNRIKSIELKSIVPTVIKEKPDWSLICMSVSEDREQEAVVITTDQKNLAIVVPYREKVCSILRRLYGFEIPGRK